MNNLQYLIDYMNVLIHQFVNKDINMYKCTYVQADSL